MSEATRPQMAKISARETTWSGVEARIFSRHRRIRYTSDAAKRAEKMRLVCRIGRGSASPACTRCPSPAPGGAADDRRSGCPAEDDPPCGSGSLRRTSIAMGRGGVARVARRRSTPPRARRSRCSGSPGVWLGDFDLGRGGIDLRRALINKLRRRATLADERPGLFDRLGPPFVVADLESCLPGLSVGRVARVLFSFAPGAGRVACVCGYSCVGVVRGRF